MVGQNFCSVSMQELATPDLLVLELSCTVDPSGRLEILSYVMRD
jgi:hypothetical protein